MLHIRRRHIEGDGPDVKGKNGKWKLSAGGCPDRHKGGGFIECKGECPLWVNGKLDGRQIRKSLETNVYSVAKEIVKAYAEDPKAITQERNLARTIEAFLNRKKCRDASAGTVRNYREALTLLLDYCEPRGLRLTTDITREDLEKFSDSRMKPEGPRKGEPIASSTRKKEYRILRTFFTWCVDTERLAKNPSDGMEKIKVKKSHERPYTEADAEALLEACMHIRGWTYASTAYVRQHTYTLTLFLLLTGLRISDALRLERSKIDFKTGALNLWMLKTDEPMYCMLPPRLLAALDALPKVHDSYVFWNGRQSIEGVAVIYARRLKAAASIAKITGAKPHRARRTFAMTLLDHGNEMRTVQTLLGHQHIETTEIYTGITGAQQRLLTEAVSCLKFGETAAAPRLLDAG